eukprot:CAMPEP_0204271228 /NCGR_PEP_ID=MMETSP0468-20130131/19337_1 /ASSEMBLY_ACC=CAM_ASM_000383 /TAXON_ID=2969 /ORGANISM="Oxyrrhis marina" /LENGTH=77 /DNA_ID=CAMNT_0051246853 /DNA_START=175 /DNA_END=408 /DNA_ORIENTATION=+
MVLLTLLSIVMAQAVETQAPAVEAEQWNLREDFSTIYCFAAGIIIAHFLNVITGSASNKSQADATDCGVQRMLWMLG